jgi:hypothetical protein
MSKQESSEKYAYIKVEQPNSLNEMPSPRQIQAKIVLEDNEDRKVKVNIIHHFDRKQFFF